jgi:hypothetical protein
MKEQIKKQTDKGTFFLLTEASKHFPLENCSFPFGKAFISLWESTRFPLGNWHSSTWETKELI